jgi:hypothetical protein
VKVLWMDSLKAATSAKRCSALSRAKFVMWTGSSTSLFWGNPLLYV